MAAARAIAPIAAPPELVRAFASDRLSVAAPVLAAARLTAADWAEVSAGASAECRRFIASLRSETPGLQAFPPPPEPPASARLDSDAPIPSISEVVARIERLRQSREEPEAPPPPPPAEEPPTLFRWECDPAGEITWVDGVPRGAVIGRSIARGGEGGDIDRSVERAFAMRAPFSDARLELSQGSIAGGTWKISGMPVFDSASGRFSGFHGVAERELAPDPLTFVHRDPASLRELAHELKTPLNAIIGFAEIISGQYLGPTGQPYRERADTIVEQAQLLVTAIDDLDFAARLHAGNGDPPRTSRSPPIWARSSPRLAPELTEAGAGIVIDRPAATALDAALSSGSWRAFSRRRSPDSPEPQSFSVSLDQRFCVVSAGNPGFDPGSASQACRCAWSGLARIAGGDLVIGLERIELRASARLNLRRARRRPRQSRGWACSSTVEPAAHNG